MIWVCWQWTSILFTSSDGRWLEYLIPYHTIVLHFSFCAYRNPASESSTRSFKCHSIKATKPWGKACLQQTRQLLWRARRSCSHSAMPRRWYLPLSNQCTWQVQHDVIWWHPSNSQSALPSWFVLWIGSTMRLCTSRWLRFCLVFCKYLCWRWSRGLHKVEFDADSKQRHLLSKHFPLESPTKPSLRPPNT